MYSYGRNDARIYNFTQQVQRDALSSSNPFLKNLSTVLQQQFSMSNIEKLTYTSDNKTYVLSISTLPVNTTVILSKVIDSNTLLVVDSSTLVQPTTISTSNTNINIQYSDPNPYETGYNLTFDITYTNSSNTINYSITGKYLDNN